jgi:hypothetical protein
MRWPFLGKQNQDDCEAEIPIPLDNNALGPLGALINELNEPGTDFNPYRDITEMWASWILKEEGRMPWIRRGEVMRGVGEIVGIREVWMRNRDVRRTV